MREYQVHRCHGKFVPNSNESYQNLESTKKNQPFMCLFHIYCILQLIEFFLSCRSTDISRWKCVSYNRNQMSRNILWTTSLSTGTLQSPHIFCLPWYNVRRLHRRHLSRVTSSGRFSDRQRSSNRPECWGFSDIN